MKGPAWTPLSIDHPPCTFDPAHVPLVTEWTGDGEDQTQCTASPAGGPCVAGTNDVVLFGPTWTVTVPA